jgi:hypothetical protein
VTPETLSFGGRPCGLQEAPACPAALPSGSSAATLLSGDWSALPAVVGYTAARAALIGVGLFAAGERAPARLARNAAAGALAIEVFVIGWAAWKLRQKQ